MMEETFVIDKVYAFYAVGSGTRDEVNLHLQLEHDDVMMYGQSFAEESESESEEEDEVGVWDDIKDLLDETLANEYAEILYQEWEDNHDDEDEDLTVDDFYDAGWETVAETYYYYCWSPEFKKDCVEYYNKNK